MEHTYRTKNVCSMQIHFTLDGDVVRDISFLGGCDGMTVGQIEQKLKGNTCGRRPTSCADQLAIAVRQAYEEESA